MISKSALFRSIAIFGILKLTLLTPTPGFAAEQLTKLPDPASVTIPDIASSDPKVLADGYKFFVFISSSVAYATAYADLVDCHSFLPAGPGRALPGFTPWITSQSPQPVKPELYPYGLVGAALGAIILPKLQQGQNNTVMRRCMELRGYKRYAVSEAVWTELNDPKNIMAFAMQAKIATGQIPPQREIVDQ